MLYYLLDHLPTILDLSALRTRRRLGSATVKQKREALVMLYDSTKSLLQTILRSLESGDENRWDDQTESGKACLYEMHQMSGSLYKPYKPDRLNATSLAQSHLPEKLTRAIPHVKTMVIAIRLKDQTRALESGQAALDEMNGARFSVIPGGRIAPTAESCEAAVVREHEKPVRKRRLSVRDRQILLPSTT
jgi:exonuclease VII small subunit